MKIYGYTVTKNSTLKSKMNMISFNAKTLGYKYICVKCNCPLLDDEVTCPDCYGSLRKKI